MPYAYRLVIRLQPKHGRELPEGMEHPFELETYGAPVSVTVPTNPESDYPEVTLGARGFESYDEALAAGEAASSAVRATGLLLHVPMDFGLEAGNSGGFTPAYRDKLEEQFDAQVLNSVHGLQVYEHDGRDTVFVGGTAVGVAPFPARSFIDTLQRCFQDGVRLSAKESLAADLYLLADFETSARARFISLVTALEVLATRREYVGPLREFLDDAMQRLQELPAQVRETREFRSFEGQLRQLSRQSISQAVRDLVADNAPPDVTYAGVSPGEFAKVSYNVRSQLVHDGIVPGDVDLRQQSLDLRRLVAAVFKNACGLPSERA